MKIHNVVQGTEEWHKLRKEVDGTASEAAAMMGDSPYMTRDELLKQKATGIEREITPFQQKLFDDGHRAEAGAMPILEGIFDDEFYSLTGSIEIDGLKLLASFDGITMSRDVVAEHKLYNKDLIAIMRRMFIPAPHYWQLEHQLLVSGAEKVVFACSDGTEDTLDWVEYRSLPERRKDLIASWKQFKIDLENYVNVETKEKPEASAIEDFPALLVDIEGGVKSSNLELYKSNALAFIEGINTDLKTDEDFANAEAIAKFCDKAEKELEVVKKRALSQTESIDELFRAIDVLKGEMKSKRLTLTKLVKSEKDNIKTEIASDALSAHKEHIAAITKSIGIHFANPCNPDFAAVMKNKRTLESIRNAVNTELARVKIANNERADVIRANLLVLEEKAKDYRFLFNDLHSIAEYEVDAFSAVVNERVSNHKAEEKRKLEAERERIRAEEEAKAIAKTRESADKAKADAEAEAQLKKRADDKDFVAAATLLIEAPKKGDGGTMIVNDLRAPDGDEAKFNLRVILDAVAKNNLSVDMAEKMINDHWMMCLGVGCEQ